jgi:hypothetical protein
VQKLALPGEYVSLSRIDLGMTAILATLQASSNWRGIREELDCDGPPATEYGRLEFDYLERARS